MTKVKIYHNPRCSKSRQTLALIRERGCDVEIVEYLKDPPNAATLRRLLKQLGMQPRELLRKREHAALQLPASDDAEELIRRMAQHPEIIERPIVVSGSAARLGRPPENVLEILPP